MRMSYTAIPPSSIQAYIRFCMIYESYSISVEQLQGFDFYQCMMPVMYMTMSFVMCPAYMCCVAVAVGLLGTITLQGHPPTMSSFLYNNYLRLHWL